MSSSLALAAFCSVSSVMLVLFSQSALAAATTRLRRSLSTWVKNAWASATVGPLGFSSTAGLGSVWPVELAEVLLLQAASANRAMVRRGFCMAATLRHPRTQRQHLFVR